MPYIDEFTVFIKVKIDNKIGFFSVFFKLKESETKALLNQIWNDDRFRV